MRSLTLDPQVPAVHTLDNGLRVALERLPHVHSASIGVWIRVGSACEAEEVAGISHLVEHLLFKGTERRNSRQIDEAVESRGGQLNAFTSREYTCIYAKVLEDDLPTAIDVLADVVQHSQCIDLEKERNVILEEIAASDDVPEEFIHDEFGQRLWPGHPMGRPVAGFERTVEAISLDQVRDFFRRWYHPENMIVSVAGQIDEAEVLGLLEKAFAAPAAPFAPFDPGAPPPAQPGAHTLTRAIGQYHLCFGFPGARSTDDSRFAFDVLNSALGGGSTSRLFQRVREDEGLAYSIYAFNCAYPLTGMFGVYAAVAPESLEQTLDICFEELRDLRQNPMPESELSLNREQLKGGLLMAMESTFNRMGRMAKSLMYHGRIVPVDEVVRRVDAVTSEEVRALAERVFTPDQCVSLTLGPETPAPGGLIRL